MKNIKKLILALFIVFLTIPSIVYMMDESNDENIENIGRLSCYEREKRLREENNVMESIAKLPRTDDFGFVKDVFNNLNNLHLRKGEIEEAYLQIIERMICQLIQFYQGSIHLKKDNPDTFFFLMLAFRILNLIRYDVDCAIPYQQTTIIYLYNCARNFFSGSYTYPTFCEEKYQALVGFYDEYLRKMISMVPNDFKQFVFFAKSVDQKIKFLGKFVSDLLKYDVTDNPDGCRFYNLHCSFKDLFPCTIFLIDCFSRETDIREAVIKEIEKRLGYLGGVAAHDEYSLLIFKYFIAFGVDVNAKTDEYPVLSFVVNYYLHFATCEGLFNMINFLKIVNFDFNALSMSDNNILHLIMSDRGIENLGKLARRTNCDLCGILVPLIKNLLEVNRVNVLAQRTPFRETPLHDLCSLSLRHEEFETLAKILVCFNPATIEAKDRYGKMPGFNNNSNDYNSSQRKTLLELRN